MNYHLTMHTYEEKSLLFTHQTTCLIEDDILEFSTENDNITINLTNFYFKKKNFESTLKLTPNECTLKLKEINEPLNIPLEYLNYHNDNNKNITIEYKLISQDKPLKIEIIIGGEYHEIQN